MCGIKISLDSCVEHLVKSVAVKMVGGLLTVTLFERLP
jgi:hypothetical protein